MNNSHTKILIGAVLMMVLMFAGTAISAELSDILADISRQVENAPNATPEIVAFAKANLLPLCKNEVFVKAVAEQNAKGITLDQIKKIDEEWQAAEELLPIHEELTGNACAQEILKIAKANSAITEMFVMDNQGANVGQNAITSDYWQGDEAKWKNSFNNGAGGVDLSKPQLDKSTNRMDQKVSLPIVDASGTVIGAVCVGIAL